MSALRPLFPDAAKRLLQPYLPKPEPCRATNSIVISTTPLAFKLVCKDTVLKTLGDAARLCGELTPEQREEYCRKVAVHALNNAIKEPRYIKAATIMSQTALNLSGMLAQSPVTDG